MRRVLALFVLAPIVPFAFAACGGGETNATPPATPSSTPSNAPSASASAATTPTTVMPVSSAAVAFDACKVLDSDRAPGLARLKEVAESKDPMSHSGSFGEEGRRIFGECTRTKSGGAWGLGVQDLKEEQHGYSAVAFAIHVDKTGAKASFALPGQSPRTATRSYAAHDSDHVTFNSATAFDFDGDGEDELVILGQDQTKEGPKDPIGQIVTFKNGQVSLLTTVGPYPFFRTTDADADGRPDLVTYGPYRSRIPARCNGQASIAQGPALLLHSKPDGTFSINDDVAMKFAKQACEKPGFTVARDDEKRVDDEQTFVNIACARMWGMPIAQANQAVASQCNVLTGEAACKDAALKSCVYPNEMKAWIGVLPPLAIK
jgi:hypothetical protein